MDAESLWFPGLAAFSKDKCQFCKTKIKINPIGLIVGFALNMGIFGALYIGATKIYDNSPANIQEALGIFLFAAFLPFGIIIFYIIVPICLAVIGARLYEKE